MYTWENASNDWEKILPKKRRYFTDPVCFCCYKGLKAHLNLTLEWNAHASDSVELHGAYSTSLIIS